MAAQGITAQIGAILPFGRVRIASASVTQVAVLDLAVEGKALVHGVA